MSIDSIDARLARPPASFLFRVGVGRTQPLGSAILDAMNRDSKANEALALHGDTGLTWSQIYDIIDVVGGVRRIVKAG